MKSYDTFTGSEGDTPTCYLEKVTEIHETDVTFDKNLNDRTIKALLLYNNKNIQYLPVDVYKSFPNIRVVAAQRCSIKKIKRNNFINLAHVVSLELNYNQIEIIHDDTFLGLSTIERIGLSKFY